MRLIEPALPVESVPPVCLSLVPATVMIHMSTAILVTQGSCISCIIPAATTAWKGTAIGRILKKRQFFGLCMKRSLSSRALHARAGLQLPGDRLIRKPAIRSVQQVYPAAAQLHGKQCRYPYGAGSSPTFRV